MNDERPTQQPEMRSLAEYSRRLLGKVVRKLEYMLAPPEKRKHMKEVDNLVESINSAPKPIAVDTAGASWFGDDLLVSAPNQGQFEEPAPDSDFGVELFDLRNNQDRASQLAALEILSINSRNSLREFSLVVAAALPLTVIPENNEMDRKVKHEAIAQLKSAARNSDLQFKEQFFLLKRNFESGSNN